MNPLLLDLPDHLDGARLVLRAPRPGESGALNAAVCESLEELRVWMPWAQEAPSLEESEEYSRRTQAAWILREDLPWRIYLKNGERFLGVCGLHRIDWKVPRFEIGYWLHSRFAGQGYMSEAAEIVTRFAFETLGAHRVEIRADDRNTRSWRIPERLGFALEGTLRGDVRDHFGVLRDTRVYAKVTPDDFFSA